MADILAYLGISYTFVVNTWYHIAIVRNGGKISAYINGVLVGSVDKATTYEFSMLPTMIGHSLDTNTDLSGFAGYIDEFRISKVARWTADFTPPTAAYGYDANTVVLLHF